MKRIFFFTDDISQVGGAEKVIVNLANEFIENMEITIISSNNNYVFQYKVNKNIRFINLNIKSKNMILKKIEIINKINKINFKNEDIIIGVGAWNCIILPFLKKKGVIKIASEHLAYEKVPLRIGIARKIMYKYIDAITCLTDGDTDNYKKINKKVFVIPNFINLDFHDKSNLSNKKIIAIGRLAYQKGFDILLDIWKGIELVNKEWVLEIYGDGDLKTELLKQKEKLRLKNVFFKGETREIEKKLVESSIYLMSSRYEGFPLVLLEAMSLGVPCISFDCKTGPKDMILDGENGFLIEEGNIKKYQERVIELINNSELRNYMSKNTEKIIEKYSKKKILKSWLDMFEELKVIKNDR
ncbi:MAG: glycosyltransferase family 4 protein [Fusobacteriaceae bacterium]